MSRRQRLLAGIAGVSILAIAGGLLYLKSGSTPVPVNETVRRFRAQSMTTATAKPEVEPKSAQAAGTPVRTNTVSPDEPVAATAVTGRPLPPAGVYEYATTGFDEVDVLGGSRHTYPSKTTVTVRHSRCGIVERWDALKERWDERETCRTPTGDTLHRLTGYHEFFRHGDLRTYNCRGFAYPMGAEPGDTWKARCVSGSSIVETTGRAVAWENVTVDGKAVRTLHVRVDAHLTGEQVGSGRHEVWGASASGLALREIGTVTSHSKQPVFGDTTYHEEFEIRLLSLAPRT